MQNIIVMSHLRWNFVHQRPQHLLSRLAAHYRILFFEEPVCHPKKHLAVISEPQSQRDGMDTVHAGGSSGLSR